MDAQRHVEHLIRTHNLPLLRQNGHKVYGLPSGRILVVSASASDHRSWKNLLSIMRREGLEVRK